jgi:hypothetical protein
MFSVPACLNPTRMGRCRLTQAPPHTVRAVDRDRTTARASKERTYGFRSTFELCRISRCPRIAALRHPSNKPVSRAGGCSATAAAAYRWAERASAIKAPLRLQILIGDRRPARRASTISRAPRSKPYWARRKMLRGWGRELEGEQETEQERRRALEKQRESDRSQSLGKDRPPDGPDCSP